MVTRRQALVVGLMVPLAAACETVKRPTSNIGGVTATGLEEVDVVCPAVVPGSITGQSGSVGGWVSAFVDGCGDRQGVNATPGVNSQWQYPVMLSDKANAGSNYQQNKVVKGSRRLLLALVAGRLDSTSCPFPAADSGHTVAATWGDGAGNSYRWVVTFSTFSASSCKQSDKTATGGTVTIAAIDALSVSGSYSLSFGADSLAGTFTAPRAAVAGLMTPEDFTGCPTRPAQTCVNP